MGEEPAPPAKLTHVALPALSLVAAVAFALSGAGPTTVWYVVRAAGIVAYALVTLTVAGGLVVTNRALPAGQPRVDAYEGHRFLALLTISAAGFHALALLLDNYIGFSPLQVFVPLTAGYRPAAVSLGILALYVAMGVYASFYLKRFIGQKTWRAVHYSTFAVFALATYHGILSGADTGQPWMLVVYLVSIITVMALLVYRIARAAEQPVKPSRGRGDPAAVSPLTKPPPAADLAWRRPEPASDAGGHGTFGVS